MWRWPCGFAHRYLLGFDPAWVYTQLCCVGCKQWRWGSSSSARSSYTGHRDWCKEATDFDLECSSNIQLRRIFSFYLFQAIILIWVFLYINHIAICMRNSLKCWFKHTLPCMHINMYVSTSYAYVGPPWFSNSIHHIKYPIKCVWYYSWSTHYFAKSQKQCGAWAFFSLSDTKFVNTCSFTIHFKIINACSKIFVESIIYFGELK